MSFHKQVKQRFLERAGGAPLNEAERYSATVEPAQVDAGEEHWRVLGVYHLSADENRGRHAVYVDAVDEQGRRVQDPNLRIGWSWAGRKPDEGAPPAPLDKQEGEPAGNVPINNQDTVVEVWIEGNGPSDRVRGLTSKHPDERTPKGEIGNSFGHHSYYVLFQKARKDALPVVIGGVSTEEQKPPTNGHDGPAGAPGDESSGFPPFTNQQVIDAFYNAAAAQGRSDRYSLLAQAGLDVNALAADQDTRARIYSGPPLEKLALSAEERQLVAEKLGELLGIAPEPTPPTPTSPTPTPAAPGDELAPPPERRMVVPAGATPAVARAADAWNRYGGYLAAKAAELGVPADNALAVLLVESGGRAVGADGRLIIRFEVHIFRQQMGVQAGAEGQARSDRHFLHDPALAWTDLNKHLFRANPAAPWQPVHADQQSEYAALSLARGLNETAALNSISMGAAQVMGFNSALLGYPTAKAMFDDFSAGPRRQLESLFRFMAAHNLQSAVRNEDFFSFARVYNGTGQPEYYRDRMVEALQAIRTARAAQPQAAPLPADAVQPAAFPLPTAPHLPAPGTGGVAQPGAPAAAPLPAPGPAGKSLQETDPELYKAWSEHIAAGYRNNQTMFDRVLSAYMLPYYTTIVLYVILFIVGIGAFIAALWSAYNGQAWGVTATFAGLSVVTLLSFFVRNPLKSLEQNLIFITWLGLIYNTYWSRLTNTFDSTTVHQELDDATNKTIASIKELLAAHRDYSKDRPGLE